MRLVVVICVLGMGVDIFDVEFIIYYGILIEVESYV